MRRAALVLLAVLAPSAVLASDHLDAPAGTTDPAADLSDVFAWMSADGTQVNLMLNIRGGMFSNAVGYVFNISSTSNFGDDEQQYRILCTFDAQQNVQCWAGNDDYANGDARSPSGLTSRRGRMRIFTGQRNDPFYFNRAGLDAMLQQAAMTQPQFDNAGCPLIDAGVAQMLINQLATAPGGAPAADYHAGDTISSLVIQIDKTLVNPGGALIAVWASTHAAG